MPGITLSIAPVLIISFYQPPDEIGAFLSSILLMKKPRHKEINNLPEVPRLVRNR